MIDQCYQERVLEELRRTGAVPAGELTDDERSKLLGTTLALAIAARLALLDLSCSIARELPPLISRFRGIPR